MTRKNVNLFQIAKAKSLSATFQATPTVITYMDTVGYQIKVTTVDSTGTFTVQGSLDYNANVSTGQPPNAGTWTNLTMSGTPVVAAANDSIMINLEQLPFNSVRLNYTSTTAGTGFCDIFVMSKQQGG